MEKTMLSCRLRADDNAPIGAIVWANEIEVRSTAWSLDNHVVINRLSPAFTIEVWTPAAVDRELRRSAESARVRKEVK